MKKWKALLSCLAAMCAIGVFAACDNQPDSTPSGSSPSGSTPDTGASTPAPTTYTVRFVNDDGSVISEETYEAGDTVVVPNDPEKAADETYTYTFAGWDETVVAVEGDATYTATYTSTYINYTVKFLDEDGEVISEKTDYHYGDTVTVPADPTKEADNTYTYTFAGWDTDPAATVAGNATYTASFTSEYIEYTVKFVSDNGEVISEKTDYHYGETVAIPDDPEKAATEYFTFAFEGWDNEVSQTVAGNATYTAKFAAAQKAGVKANKLSAGEGEGIVLGEGQIGDEAHYSGSNNIATPPVVGTVNQGYLAFDGNYSFNDYIAFDFTGKNMPAVAFFAQNYNESMYYQNGDKYGLVVSTGFTDWQGNLYTENQDSKDVWGAKGLLICGPYMLNNTLNSGKNGVLGFDGTLCSKSNTNVALGRANLVDGKHYRVVMGMEKGDHAASVKIVYSLYDLDNQEVIEEFSAQTYNFFVNDFVKEGEGRDQSLQGSIVLYGHFGTATTIDKVHGVFEDTTLQNVANGLNSDETYTVTFKNANGETLKTVEDVAFGETVSYDEALPTPEKTQDALFNYAYAWDKALGKITADTEYTLTLVATPKDGVRTHNATTNGTNVVLASGSIGNGANYTKGQNNAADGTVEQAYLALDGDYGFGNYITFDFTGKNMPEVMFFAKNYNNSMYYSEGKQGIVVASGITFWNGTTGTAQTNNTKVGVSGPFGAYYESAAAPYGGNMLSDFEAKLARENLVDGTQYRIIMGIENGGSNFTLKYCLYDLTNGKVVEEVSQTSWNFFNGQNDAVNKMTLEGLSGSIVLYGKFGTTCTLDTLPIVENGTYAEVVEKHTPKAN